VFKADDDKEIKKENGNLMAIIERRKLQSSSPIKICEAIKENVLEIAQNYHNSLPFLLAKRRRYQII
jgi:hypothetical protein